MLHDFKHITLMKGLTRIPVRVHQTLRYPPWKVFYDSSDGSLAALSLYQPH